MDGLRARAAKSAVREEKAFCAEQIRQIEAYRAELQNYTLELPTITFEKSYVLQDPAHDLHIEFHGHAHTAGDVVVFCPQKRVVATGDMIHGFLSLHCRRLPADLARVPSSRWASLISTKILPGHATLQDRAHHHVQHGELH